MKGRFVFIWSTKCLFKIKARIVKIKNKQEKEVIEQEEQQKALSERQQTTSEIQKILRLYRGLRYCVSCTDGRLKH